MNAIARRSVWPVVLLLVCRGLATLIAPRNAWADGAFPAVSQLASDPSDATHVVLRSNFGLLTTHDRGANWDLVCEACVGRR